MYISNEELEKIKEYVDNLYWDQDRMSRDGRYFLNKLDNEINNKSKDIEIEKTKIQSFYSTQIEKLQLEKLLKIEQVVNEDGTTIKLKILRGEN